MKKHFMYELLGTAFLLSVVTGSGYMGTSLGPGNPALTLLGNSIATGAGLYVLISTVMPFSFAHFNPLVSMVAWSKKLIDTPTLFLCFMAQFLGAIAGVWITHGMFGLPLIQSSSQVREGFGILMSEFLGSLILLFVIHHRSKSAQHEVPLAVALIVTAGYWFTSSTFFCNPAVTVARSMTNTFVGIHPGSILGFIVSQASATVLFILVTKSLNKKNVMGS